MTPAILLDMPGVRQDLQRSLHELAFRQAGYFTAAQAVDVGYSYQAQKHHADSGNWARVDRGIYRLPGWPASPEDAFVRWALWSRGRGVLSHESALSVHGLSDVDPRRIHLTVGTDFHARDDAVVLHVAELAERDVEKRGAWALTTVPRTLFDVAACDTSQEQVSAAIGDALDSGLVRRRDLLQRADGVGERAALRVERALAAAERT